MLYGILVVSLVDVVLQPCFQRADSFGGLVHQIGDLLGNDLAHCNAEACSASDDQQEDQPCAEPSPPASPLVRLCRAEQQLLRGLGVSCFEQLRLGHPTLLGFCASHSAALDPLLYAGPRGGTGRGGTGGGGGTGGKGSRFPIPVTRAVISAITKGQLESCETEHLDMLNLSIPTVIEGVDKSYLNPRSNWDNVKEYDEQAKKLAELFIENIVSFAPSQNIIAAGPKV